MARLRSKRRAGAPARCSGIWGISGIKSLKCLAFVAFCWASLGCASRTSTAFDRQLLVELEEKNARLEAEVTRLREEKLRAAREVGCPDVDEATGDGEDEPPSDLPLVKVDPSEEGELPDGAALVRPAAPVPQEDPVPEGTRPVLKVRGQHEAWVFHRPLTAEDKKAKSVSPETQPDKEDEQ